MSDQKYAVAIKGYIDKMPSLPTSVTKVLEICNDPKASPADLNRVISVDPVLMGKVMKLINSAYYGLNQEITSLVRAIIMLGINTVKNLALSTAVLGNLGDSTNADGLNMEGFWQHSLCVGVTSKLIAVQRKVDRKEHEEYFMAGLLHDIGKIPLNNRLSKVYVETLGSSEAQNLPLYVAETNTLGTNHAEVGAVVAENWQLSEEIRDVVDNHHTTETYSGQFKDIVFTVALANYFANTSEIGFSGNRNPEKLDTEVYAHLDIDLTYIEDEMQFRVNSEIEKARIFLQIAG